ncbi:MAG: hypothetical protein HGA90_01450 [Alphaproteobacteria bacterium]|nr:hypothetical protein [Alphaproteobacteria bacterium]
MSSLAQNFLDWLAGQWNIWVAVGLFGQTLFMLRFIFQWIHSERAQQSVVPEIFWYLSLGGSLIVLVYAVHKEDLVFILSQSLGSIIYIRNIQLIWRNKKTGATLNGEAA